MTKQSKDALKSLKRVHKKNLQDQIIDEIKKANDYGLTLAELGELLKRPPNELSGRISELYKLHKVKISGTRENPRTKRAQSVWVLV